MRLGALVYSLLIYELSCSSVSMTLLAKTEKYILHSLMVVEIAIQLLRIEWLIMTADVICSRCATRRSKWRPVHTGVYCNWTVVILNIHRQFNATDQIKSTWFDDTRSHVMGLQGLVQNHIT